jgi:hypothetical protein
MKVPGDIPLRLSERPTGSCISPVSEDDVLDSPSPVFSDSPSTLSPSRARAATGSSTSPSPKVYDRKPLGSHSKDYLKEGWILKGNRWGKGYEKRSVTLSTAFSTDEDGFSHSLVP